MNDVTQLKKKQQHIDINKLLEGKRDTPAKLWNINPNKNMQQKSNSVYHCTKIADTSPKKSIQPSKIDLDKGNPERKLLHMAKCHI